MKFPIYLDYQATTPLDARVLEAMLPWMREKFGNPHSTTHSFGWEGAAAIDIARGHIAKLIHATVDEIIFTSGATEANNLVIKGLTEAFEGKKPEIITLKTEHKCVLEACAAAEHLGAKVTYLDVEPDGLVSIEKLANAIREKTVLVSVMAVNNEIGVIQPLAEIGKLCREKGVLFHSDAAQAFGKIALDVQAMNIDFMSLSGHKIYAPKGVGALYARKDAQRKLVPQMSGGGQERGIRSGTLSPALCVGFGKAAEIAAVELGDDRVSKMGHKFWDTLQAKCKGVILNGTPDQRLWGNLNVSFPGINGELLLSELKNIAVSSGAACASAVEGPSYVLQALGIPDDVAESTLRIGFGRMTSDEEAVYAAAYLVETVQKLGGCK